MKNLTIHVLLIFSVGCVGPADPSHGLVENLPVVINKSDVFSLSLRGDNLGYEKTFESTISLADNRQMISTMVVSDFSTSDSSFIRVLGLNDTLIFDYLINSNLTSTEIKSHHVVTKINISLRGFSGILDWVLTGN